jgi:ABC-2 family transporter protein
MRLKKVLALARSHIKGLLREPAALFLLILFPIVLTLFFGFSFGAIGGSEVTYSVAVVNHDLGGNVNWSQAFIDNLSNNQILKVTVYPDNISASSDLSQGKVQALILIPQGFSESCLSYLQAPATHQHGPIPRWLCTLTRDRCSPSPPSQPLCLRRSLIPSFPGPRSDPCPYKLVRS